MKIPVKHRIFKLKIWSKAVKLKRNLPKNKNTSYPKYKFQKKKKGFEREATKDISSNNGERKRMQISGYFPLPPVINTALINLVSRQKLSARGSLMEPSCFKRATSRVKRWKGERLRHHRTRPVRTTKRRGSLRGYIGPVVARWWSSRRRTEVKSSWPSPDWHPDYLKHKSSLRLNIYSVPFKIRKLWF